MHAAHIHTMEEKVLLCIPKHTTLRLPQIVAAQQNNNYNSNRSFLDKVKRRNGNCVEGKKSTGLMKKRQKVGRDDALHPS
jgi:hypothetical protein